MKRAGFTRIELSFLLVVGCLLASMALRGSGPATGRLSAREAQRSFRTLHRQARAHAIEHGVPTRLQVDARGDSAWVTAQDGRIAFHDFAAGSGVDVRAAPQGVITLCMSPEGFADAECTSFTDVAHVAFVRGQEWEVVTLFPLGQIR